MSLFKKRFSLLCVASALILSSFAAVTAYAADTTDTEVSALQQANIQSAKTFTINDAISYAKEHSSSLAAVKASEAYAKSSANEARISRSILKDQREMSVTDVSQVLVTSGYAYNAALANSRMAQRAVIQTEYTLESNVSVLFYTYLSNVEKVSIAKDSLISAQELTKSAELKYSGGFISDIDMEKTRIAEDEARAAVNSAERNLELSMIQFKSGINYPLDQPLQLTGEFTQPQKEETSYETALIKAEKSISRANAEDTFKIASQKKKVYHGYYTSNQPAWHSAEAEYATAELNYTNALNNERINLYSAWNAVQSAYESMNNVHRNLELMQKSVDAAKISYELGTMSTKDYLDLTRELHSLKNNCLDVELMLYSANEQYRLLFDCENTVFEEDTIK
ncbi:MAG: TolC family protein [bacterium]|nr:TolC family protein [bacterium]